MVHSNNAIITWLEKHWVAPAYAGGVLLGLAIAFFGAAVNSLSGWLYAISGVMFAIILVSIWSPPRSLTGMQVERSPIRPVSVGDPLVVDLTIHNFTARPKVLLQVRDDLPLAMGPAPETAIAAIPSHGGHAWTYTCHPTRRGLYHWQTLTLRSAAPLGLFWCQRPQAAPAHATIYPEILPLTRCPLVEQMGMSSGLRWQTSRQAQNANDGLTRALRPYRWGDPTRLIHWRTSARYGELRVREQEELTADNQVLIGLDTGACPSEAAFEAAIIAAASIYSYGLHHQLSVALWLPHTGILQNKHAVLSALAEVMPAAQSQRSLLPSQPMIWLSPSGHPPTQLPTGSLWVQWLNEGIPQPTASAQPPALTIHGSRPLLEQLQQPI